MKRRELLGLGGMTLVGAAWPASPARAQTPKRGGTVYVAVWDRALKNYGPNLGVDWGSRLTAAWLDR